MLIQVIKEYKDTDHKNKVRKVGQLFNVSDARGKQILKKGYAKAVEIEDLEELKAIEAKKEAEKKAEKEAEKEAEPKETKKRK